MRITKFLCAACVLGAAIAVPSLVTASNHREAPITALDHKADITDVFAFVSFDENQVANTPPSKVTFIMCVDPLLDPANGPTLFPFDPDILYQIHVDNDRDAVEDVTFSFRFETEFRAPGLYTAVAGIGNGANSPTNGAPVVPPQITDFDSAGLNLRQRYWVAKTVHGASSEVEDPAGQPFYAVPANAGPRTIDYPSVFNAGTYQLPNGISLFAGTVDDPFFIDLGAAFDTANFRTLSSGIPGVLSAAEDSARQNFASDTISGFAVNAIAIEVPIEMVTRTGMVEPASSADATIGVWCTTSRRRTTIRRAPEAALNQGPWRQVQRLGNPLINELVIGIGSKDRFSMEQPKNDAQFANFLLDPPIVKVVEALYGGALTVPCAPRNDLLPLVQYMPPFVPAGTPPGPVADLLRLNTGIPATPPANQSRLGLIGGDPAGFPNGRRPIDDVVDVTLRVVVGGIASPGFFMGPNNQLGDGVNVNDAPLRNQFPYLADCPSGRNRRHIDPGEPGGGPVR